MFQSFKNEERQKQQKQIYDQNISVQIILLNLSFYYFLLNTFKSFTYFNIIIIFA